MDWNIDCQLLRGSLAVFGFLLITVVSEINVFKELVCGARAEAQALAINFMKKGCREIPLCPFLSPSAAYPAAV